MSSHDQDLATGENRIQWARAHMPILRKIRDDFARDRPFEGLTIAVCLHLEAKTAVWFDALVAGGARIVATGSCTVAVRSLRCSELDCQSILKIASRWGAASVVTSEGTSSTGSGSW